MFSENYFNLLNNILFISVFISTALYWFQLSFKFVRILNRIGEITSRFATLNIFLFLLIRWIEYGYFPLSNLYESLLFLSFILLFSYQLLESKAKSPIFGGIVLPIVLLISGFAELTLPLEMQKAGALVPALQSNWLMMHVSLMMLSYAILLIGSAFSIVYLVTFLVFKYTIRPFEKRYFDYQESMRGLVNLVKGIALTREDYKIRSSTQSSYACPEIISLNNIFLEQEAFAESARTNFLSQLDKWSSRTISLGFPFLTIGIIAGAVWANEAWGTYWSWDPKETWALITWLIFAAYLHLRLIVGVTGKGPSFLASIAFFVVWICYLGVNFLGQGLHSYGWFVNN
uniref:cytochrome c biogenesis protein n=1 Tax=Sargassum siliquastrum TaxID=127572 RepID=UPI00207A42ED|nr:cytochrome c biogenesis protein [Sargassum siliquastrum]YP_010485362.1 cytochrome c biogenesis protein [Sargassum macrocarpum]YP_010485501.1 cytochrome c biogenesis protein [Sargassum serratifolium]URP30888.1 cytochrome c biogenesis protein [Sargassum siliquastrum]UVW81295.1 cytochrome c biogenesis protein [Sargassum macrocarpum]UVW81434.1 cytochrome c biogenesis protein [Sargassum serratifolium]